MERSETAVQDEAHAAWRIAGAVKQMIKHVLSLQADAGQKLVLLFDPSSQTLVSSPYKDTHKKRIQVSFHGMTTIF